MCIARSAATGRGSTYGIIKLGVDDGEHPEIIATIAGGPLIGVSVNYTGTKYDLADIRLLTPIIPRSKIVAIGRNHIDHAVGQGASIPEEPMLLIKPNTCMIGPNEPIICSEEREDLHHEDELAIVVRWIYKQASAQRAAKVVFGYAATNNVTA